MIPARGASALEEHPDARARHDLQQLRLPIPDENRDAVERLLRAGKHSAVGNTLPTESITVAWGGLTRLAYAPEIIVSVRQQPGGEDYPGALVYVAAKATENNGALRFGASVVDVRHDMVYHRDSADPGLLINLGDAMLTAAQPPHQPDA